MSSNNSVARGAWPVRARQEEAAVWRYRRPQPGSVGDRTGLDHREPGVGRDVVLAVLPPGGVLGAKPRRVVEIDRDRRESLPEPWGVEADLAVLDHVPSPVKDQAVVGADRIGIGDRALVIRRPGGEQFAPGLDDVGTVR